MEILSSEALEELRKHQDAFTELVTNAHGFLRMPGAEANVDNWQLFLDAREKELKQYSSMYGGWVKMKKRPDCTDAIRTLITYQQEFVGESYSKAHFAITKAQKIHKSAY